MFADNLNMKLLPLVKYLNINKFDWFIRSNGNSNHQIAAVKTLETIPIDTVWGVGIDSNSSYDSYFRNLLYLKNGKYNVIKREEILRIDENSSLALKLVNGSSSMLFVDRLTSAEIDLLIQDSEIIKSDVLTMSDPKQISTNFPKFIDSVGAIWLEFNGIKEIKIREWK